MNMVFDALAHPTRRGILELLHRGPMTAGQLAEAFPVSKPTMSNHFAKLRAAGLILAESRGASIHYTLNLSLLEEVMTGFMSRLRVGEKKEEPCVSEG